MKTNVDQQAAPGFNPAAVGLPWFRRSVRQGLGYFAPSSAFAFVPFLFTHWDPLTSALALGAVVLMLIFFLGTTLAVEWSEGARWLWLVGLMSAILLYGFVTDGQSRPTYYMAYVTAAAAVLFTWRHARLTIIALALLALGLSVIQRDTFGIVMAMMSFVVGWGVGSSLDADRMQDALRQAEERTAVLAVAAERERIGRDLHDILGHSLTTIAVKADLARRLIPRDPDAAHAEITALADVARQALADVRATSSGIRQVRLATELASARSVLEAAGVECRTPSALPALDDARSEVFGYVVREAITNVVRHAHAQVCTIQVSEEETVITDNGRGIPAGVSHTGLAGLTHRVADAGGVLTVSSDAAGTTVRALFASTQGR